jgi:glycosyltransferase involved in cell wall biosynthesis
MALLPYPIGEAPGQRYRIEQWAPYLSEWGIDVHFEPFADKRLARLLYQPNAYLSKAVRMLQAWLRRVKVVRRSAAFDVVFLHREAALVGPAWLERLVRRRNPRIVYDFDDAVWLRYISPRNRYLSYLKAPGKTSTICRLAAAATVGNETLAEFASRYCPSVLVVPSTVSLREYRPKPYSPHNATPVIGWTGSHSSAQYLRIVEGPLRELARRQSFRLRVIGLEGYRLDGVDVDCRPWSADTEVQDLWPMDVGIMPLSDDPWSRGKCAMKAIQYMGVGLPAVVSPVGANRQVVQHGISGFHATTEREWIESLEALLNAAELRAQMGAEARQRVKALYSAEAQAPRIGGLLESLRS